MLGFQLYFVKFHSHSKTRGERYGERVAHHTVKFKVVQYKFGEMFKLSYPQFKQPASSGENRERIGPWLCRGPLFLGAPDGEQLKRANSPSRRERLYQA